jgi:hypothetical protein
LGFLEPTLHSWTIENLVKNAIDAMKGKGKLALQIEQEGEVKKCSDTGSGIQKNQFKIFLNLVLLQKNAVGDWVVKRIVEEYHNGTIKVLNSEIGKEQQCRLVLKKVV